MVITKDLYISEYVFRNIRIQSNMQGYYEKRIDITPEQLDTPHNHRRVFINEVVFDIDCHLRVISDKIHDFISSNLIKDNISHQVWDTSRSPHIHAFFKDMNLYTQEVRRYIRLLILKHYSGKYFNWIDKSKASENSMIRDFGGLHEITRKPKTLIYEFKGTNPLNPLNPLNQTILEQLGVLYHQRQKSLNLSEIEALKGVTEQDKERMQGFITYCCENVHTHDGRKRILLKNIAIACLLLGYDTQERTRIYYRITQNFRGCHINKLIGWDKWFQSKKQMHFNWREIESYYKKRIEMA